MLTKISYINFLYKFLTHSFRMPHRFDHYCFILTNIINKYS